MTIRNEKNDRSKKSGQTKMLRGGVEAKYESRLRSGEQRLEWLDVAKGIVIWLMIIGHMPNYIPPLVKEAIYSFHMPFFFVASGYCFSPEKYTVVQFVKKRVRKLLIPYYAFSLAGFFMRYILLPAEMVDVKGTLISIFIEGKGTYIEWFFLTLFWVEIVAMSLVQLKDKGIILFVVVSVVLCGAMLSAMDIRAPLRLSSACTAVGFFFIGWNLGKTCKENCLLTILWLAIMWGLCFLSMYVPAGKTWELEENVCSNMMLGFGSAVTGSLFIMECASLIVRRMGATSIPIKFLSFVGRKSFWIYPLSRMLPQTLMDLVRSRGIVIDSVPLKLGIYVVSFAIIFLFARQWNAPRYLRK